jgi:hypothetical protein
MRRLNADLVTVALELERFRTVFGVDEHEIREQELKAGDHWRREACRNPSSLVNETRSNRAR